jgi:hypothetical protein
MSKLGRLQVQRLELIDELVVINEEKKKITRKAQKIGRKLKDIGNAIYDLKHDGDTPHITDHAIVRYLERVEKVDIKELKLKVASHKDAIKDGNVVVTVNEDGFYD